VFVCACPSVCFGGVVFVVCVCVCDLSALDTLRCNIPDSCAWRLCLRNRLCVSVGLFFVVVVCVCVCVCVCDLSTLDTLRCDSAFTRCCFTSKL